MNLNLFASFLGKHGSLLVIVILVLVIVGIKVNGSIRKLAYKYIPEAEDGTIVRHFKKGALDAITRLQNSDLDERMVEVIAVLLQQIPILRIIPFSTATKYLNALAQKSFDNVTKALNTSINNIPRTSRISKSDLDDFLGESISSANDKAYELYEKNFEAVEKEVENLKANLGVKASDIPAIESILKTVVKDSK